MSKLSEKAAKTLASLKAAHTLLILICKQPQRFNKDIELRSALKTQGSLASINRSFDLETGESLTILPMSLNTLKTYANENLSGGFDSLNDLRIKAIEALENSDRRENHANKRTKSGLHRKVEQLELELEMQRQTNVILLRALSESMHQFTSIRDASDDKIRGKRTQDALQTLRAIVSMGMPPFNTVTTTSEAAPPPFEVANLDDYRKR
ncbi:hypothetical protein BBI09_05825 [Stutzerimonas xanthomarina]|nr:hypothetical protein BBI09_05825 [Stutzerimonas xanthomarina]